MSVRMFKAPKADEVATVVVMGRMYKCRVRSAVVRNEVKYAEVENQGGANDRFVVGNDVSMSVEYDVLEEVVLSKEQNAAIDKTLQQMLPHHGERQIDLD